MKTREELIEKATAYIKANPQAYKAMSLNEFMADFHLSLDEETCKWHKKGNLEGVCTETNKPIFHDLFEKAQDNLGHITYCPFCGRKIERI